MEYKGTPLKLELVNDIVEIPSVEDVVNLGHYFVRLTDGFKEPYVMLLITKGRDADMQLEILHAIREWYNEDYKLRGAPYAPDWIEDNPISWSTLEDLEFQLKYKHKPFEPDMGILVQAHIFRNNPNYKVAVLKGDWFQEGEVVFGDIINWVNDWGILGTVALVNE